MHPLDNPRSGERKFAEKASLTYRYRPEGGDRERERDSERETAINK
jgi:hypothetical protein